MKNKYTVLIVLLLPVIFMNGCYSDTVDSLSKLHFQIPLLVTAEAFNKSVPDTSYTFTNLNKYEQYTKNLDRIAVAEITQFNYFIDSLQIGDGKVYDPLTDDIEFEYIRFYLQFAVFRPGYSDTFDQDSSHYMPDPSSQKFKLGEFLNVNIRDYYRDPHNILQVSQDVASVISEAVKKRPHFFITTEYSPIKNQKGEKMNFPYIKSRYDVVIRFEVDL